MNALTNRSEWLLRIALAAVFIFHGIGKFAGMGIAGFAEMMDLPYVVALLVALAELAGGFGIVIGGFTGNLVTRLSALAMMPVLLGAIFMIHWGQWSFVASETHPMGGMEFQVVLLMIAGYFAIRGNTADASGMTSACPYT